MALCLVTGGTGFVGRAVVAELIGAGFRVRILTRHPRGAADDRIEHMAGDAADAGAVTRAVQGVQAIVHLVGIIAEQGSNTFERAHVQATETLVSAAQAAGVKRFVHMSAIGARPAAPSPYHRTKWAGEEAVRRSDLKWVILRPSLIWGPGDGFISQFSALMTHSPLTLFGTLPIPCFGGARPQLQPVWIGDVAHCFRRAVSSGSAVGRTFDLVGPARAPLPDILATLARALGLNPVYLDATPELQPFLVPWHMAHGRRPILVHVPDVLALGLAWVLQRLPGQVLTVPQVQMLLEGNVGDPAPAAREFGFQPRPFDVQGLGYARGDSSASGR